MSEKRFLNFIFLEGILLTILGLCILILPKLTSVTFGVMLSASFITYGVYKLVTSFINRNYVLNLFWNLFLAMLILTVGILLLFVPKISLLWLIAFIGIYFLLESISSAAFMSQIRNSFNSWECKFFSTVILFLVGLVIVVGLPVLSFWLVALLSGIALLVKGMTKNTIYLANRNNYNI